MIKFHSTSDRPLDKRNCGKFHRGEIVCSQRVAKISFTKLREAAATPVVVEPASSTRRHRCVPACNNIDKPSEPGPLFQRLPNNRTVKSRCFPPDLANIDALLTPSLPIERESPNLHVCRLPITRTDNPREHRSIKRKTKRRKERAWSTSAGHCIGS